MDALTSPDAGNVVTIYLSPDDQYLAVGTRDNRLSMYRLRGERLGERIGEWDANLIRKATWSDSGQAFAFIDTNEDARVVHLPSGRSMIVHGPATAIAFYPDASRLAVAHELTLRIHEFSSQSYARTIELQPGRENKGVAGDRSLLSISPDAQLIACSSETGTIQILDRVRYGTVHEFVAHQDIITDLEWIGPYLLVTASADQSIRLWDMDQGRQLRVLEVDKPVIGITYSPDRQCVIGWTRDDYLFWSVTTGQIMWRGPLAAAADFGDRKLAAFRHNALVVMLNGSAISDITFSSGFDASSGRMPEAVSTYTNAKVLLLGDSGVGKSGLALVLAGEGFRATESTHARRIWRMPTPELDTGEQSQAQQEILIWDLAGQPGYRIIHQLHLSDAAAALILFDSTSETGPLEGISYWARALQHAKALNSRENDALPTFLVAARTDRSVVSVSNERISEIVDKFGFSAFLSTSALEGWGITELRREVLAAIDWNRIPVITSSTLFAAVKSFVLDHKAAGTVLTPLASLHAAFIKAPITGPAVEVAPDVRVGGDLLGFEPGLHKDDQEQLRRVFEVCIARLESAGLVKRLAFGDMILLQPELIDVYAGAIVNAARDEPDGLGSIRESDVLTVNFKFPRKERISDIQQEKLLLITTLEELARHEIMLKEETEGSGVQLVFPAAFRRDLTELATPLGDVLEFTFEGPVENIYATLIVRLTRSDRFVHLSSWRSAARFQADSGGICTLHLVRWAEGLAAIQLSYSEDVAEIVRSQFEKFVLAHLERRAIRETVRRKRLYRCPKCRSSFTDEQIDAARRFRRIDLVCPADETRIRLEPSYQAPSGTPDSVTTEMDASADAARNIAAASSIILGKQELTDFDVFLCHNETDKPVVRWTAQRLRENGILPWLDEEELPPGRLWQEELEQQIGRIRAAAVFVGPSGIGPWQDQEMRAFLNEFVKRGCKVIPVMLPGSTPAELPVFLQGRTWVDLRAHDVVGIERLIWGITGRRPAQPG